MIDQPLPQINNTIGTITQDSPEQRANKFFAEHIHHSNMLALNLVGVGFTLTNIAFLFQEFNSSNHTSLGLAYTGLSVCLITSALTVGITGCIPSLSYEKRAPEEKKRRDKEEVMTLIQYLSQIPKSMLNPLTDPRRFYALGNFIGHCLLFSADRLNMGNLITVRGVADPLSYLAQFTALAGPIKTEHSLVAWGIIKGICHGVSASDAISEAQNNDLTRNTALVLSAHLVSVIFSTFVIRIGVDTILLDRREKTRFEDMRQQASAERNV